MNNFTTNTYQIKRKIVNFSKKICKDSNKAESKFVTDMIYGISKSKDIPLSSISEQLNEKTKKLNTINRLSDNLAKNLSQTIDANYSNLFMNSLGNNPVFLVDDSDVIKPLGEKFEDLGLVRDDSSKNKIYEKGYHITEIVGLTQNLDQPISIFSKVHSSAEKEYVSSNAVTKEGLGKVVNLLNSRNQKGIFVNDRGYDSNEIFNYYFSKKQYFVIRLTEKRKVFFKGKWYNIATLRDSRKGKIKMNIKFKKQEYNFENFRVRTLKLISNLNKLLTYAIGLIAILNDMKGKKEIINKIIKESQSLRDKVYVWFYQIARGIFNILKNAKTGIRNWENIRKVKIYDGQLSLI